MKFPKYDKKGAGQNEFMKKLVRCLAPARLIRALPSLRSEGRFRELASQVLFATSKQCFEQSATASVSSPYD